MILQAAIDDSGSEPQAPVFVLAGFVASPDQWAAFSHEWDTFCKQAPTIEYYKNNEAYGFKKQFDKAKGWTEQKRNDKVTALVRVIRKWIPERYAVSMRNTHFDEYMGGIPIRNRIGSLEDPYFMLFYEFMLIVASVRSIREPVTQCEFVFDDQGTIGLRAQSWWPQFRKELKKGQRFDFSPYFVESPPAFKKDIEFLPLQAADLYAGHLKRVLASERIIIPPSAALILLEPMFGIQRPMDRVYLGSLRRHFMSIAKRIEAEKPGTLRYISGRPKRHR